MVSSQREKQLAGDVKTRGMGDCSCHLRAYGDCTCGKDYRLPEPPMPNEPADQMTTPPYAVRPYQMPGGMQQGWSVVGPGLGGWPGVIPRTHDGMTAPAAANLADLLARAALEAAHMADQPETARHPPVADTIACVRSGAVRDQLLARACAGEDLATLGPAARAALAQEQEQAGAAAKQTTPHVPCFDCEGYGRCTGACERQTTAIYTENTPAAAAYWREVAKGRDAH